MARATNTTQARRRHKKILKLARGSFGRRSKTYRMAHQTVLKGQAHAYKDRRRRKRDFRRLWITRINAAARMNGLSYSRFMSGLKDAGVEINRKMLADLAVHDDAAFQALVERAKASLKA